MKLRIFQKIIFGLLIFCCPGTAYAQFQENANLLFNWQDPSIIGSNAFDNAYNEVWKVDANGKQYAIIGSTDGTHFFDITDKENVSFTKFHPAPLTGVQVIHRDYHDYNGYLYIVCDEGNGTSTLQILDFTGLPDTLNEVYNSMSLFSTAHNIFIDTATAKLYVCSEGSPVNGFLPMSVYSLAEPTNPQFLGSYNEAGHVHDVFVRNDTAYCHNGNQGFAIVKFEDDGSYTTLGSLTSYPEQGYNHSGWLTEDGKYYAMADETWGTRIKLLDVSDPQDIQVLSLFGSQTTNNAIAHNLIISGDYAFVAYYYDGLQVFDISDPMNPVRIAQYDTFLDDNISSYEGAWGVYPMIEENSILISDMQTGLYVFELEVRPVTNFSVSYDNGAVVFNDNSLWEPYLWSWWIDGVNVGGGAENVQQLTEGTYEVCLETFNDAGSDTLCQQIDVSALVDINDTYLLNNVKVNTDISGINFSFGLEQPATVAYHIYDANGRILASHFFNEASVVNRHIPVNEEYHNKVIIAVIESTYGNYSAKVQIR